MNKNIENQNPDRMHFAILGDVEPKPDPVFVNFEKAVAAINSIHREDPLDLAISIGDITHRGSLIQYENATQVIRKLEVPLLSIMGNEEIMSGKERFLEYAARWNPRSSDNPELHFVKTFGPYALIFATASTNGVTFAEEELDWLTQQISIHSDKHILLFTHAPAQGVFAAEPDRAISNENFKKILHHPHVRLHVSGHTHMDPDFVPTHVLDKHGVHHLHVPGIERTKVGTTHTPRFYVVTLGVDGLVDIQMYNVNQECFEDRHRISIPLYLL